MSTALEGNAAEHGTAHRVAETLRQRLLLGEWLAGTPLRETSLAMELGVSRNTLREAFRQLAVEGLVLQQLYKGVVVRPISVDQIRDIFSCRRVVELGAIAESATASEALFADVAAAISAGEAAAARGQWQEAGTASLQFHRAVVGLLESPRMNEFFLILATQLRLAFSEVQNQTAFQAPWLPRDRQIGDLLLSGRRAEASEAMSRYLSDSEKFLLDTLRSTRHQKRD